jgi:hypothetical protein
VNIKGEYMTSGRRTKQVLSGFFLLFTSTLVQPIGNNESVNGSSKKDTNIYGVLKTVHGREDIPVDNIAINGRIGLFECYEVPKEIEAMQNRIPQASADETAQDTSADASVQNERLPKKELPLPVDAMELAVIRFDLKTVFCISVLDTGRVWTYKIKGHQVPKRYLEVKIVENDKDKTETYCLMDAATKISADRRTNDESGVTETVSLAGLEDIEIQGMCVRNQKSGKCDTPLSFRKRRSLLRAERQKEAQQHKMQANQETKALANGA